jgi:hypothetical protein
MLDAHAHMFLIIASLSPFSMCIFTYCDLGKKVLSAKDVVCIVTQEQRTINVLSHMTNFPVKSEKRVFGECVIKKEFFININPTFIFYYAYSPSVIHYRVLAFTVIRMNKKRLSFRYSSVVQQMLRFSVELKQEYFI